MRTRDENEAASKSGTVTKLLRYDVMLDRPRVRLGSRAGNIRGSPQGTRIRSGIMIVTVILADRSGDRVIEIIRPKDAIYITDALR